MNDTYKQMDVSKKYPVDVHAFRKLPIILEEIQKLMSMMQDEWQFCLGLHLHPGGRPLFNPGCRCRSRNDWACSCIQCPVTTSHPSIHPSTMHPSLPSLSTTHKAPRLRATFRRSVTALIAWLHTKGLRKKAPGYLHCTCNVLGASPLLPNPAHQIIELCSSITLVLLSGFQVSP
jgi:hypothetical protein